MTKLKVIIFAFLTPLVSTVALAANTPYGSCSESAQTYQDRYQTGMRASDLVCYKKALTREMAGDVNYDCDESADHYQTAYETNQRSSDLVCYRQALKRELQ